MKYEEFKKILKKNNLTVKDFAKKSETSYNTCGTWSKSDRKVPTWVNSWLNLYEKNKQLYQLKSPILRCSFMKIPLIASDLVQMEKLWQNDDAESKLMLADYCNKYAEKYNLTEDKWYRLSDLKRILPNNSLNNIQNIKNFRSQDNTYIYLFKLLDWVSNNSTAPLDFVEKKASKIILKNRRRVLLENKRQKLFETAKYSDNVKVFTK